MKNLESLLFNRGKRPVMTVMDNLTKVSLGDKVSRKDIFSKLK